MLPVKISFGAIALLVTAASAFAFGTVRELNVLHQDAEHERITRHALACASRAASGACFQPKSMDMLAGKGGGIEPLHSGVGIPDATMISVPKAHCDMGDYLDVPGYPQSKADAQAHLVGCRAWMISKLDEAVHDADKLVDAKGHINDSQIPTYISCTFGTGKGRAKCNVLEDFGTLLHAAQDFYSHTNWVDRGRPGEPISPDNPPALGNTGPAPWLNLRNAAPSFPAGLISGCFEGVPESSHCNYGPSASLHRVKHDFLNKDKGQIDPQFGAVRTPRGSVDGNFRRAVEAAILNTSDKWATLSERLIATYGETRGKKMICAISHDNPSDDC